MNISRNQQTLLVLGALVLIAVLAAFYWGYQASAPDTAKVTAEDAARAFDANDTDGAIAAIDFLLSKNPNNISALLAKTSALAQKGSLEFKEQEYGKQAVAVANEVLALDPNNAEAWRLIGYANEIMQKYPEAHDAYAKAIKLDPKNALAVSQNAHAYDLEGSIAAAESGYQEALAIDPSLFPASMGLGRILLQQGDLSHSLRYFSVAAQSPNLRMRAEALYSMGMIERALGRLSAAESSMRSATTQDPQYPLGWVGRGAVLFDQALATSSPISPSQRDGFVVASMDALHTAATLNPYQSAAYYQLGLEYGSLSKLDTANVFLTQAAKSVPLDITLGANEKRYFLSRVESARSVLGI